ncbi:MAG: CRR6 family NdhI maturation factor, partial [Cyanobacteria bacterium J06635_11]
PLYLDWESGELSRYTAMLVPHQFSPIDGIRYNPEALEIFVMSKVFSLDTWLKRQGIDGRKRLQFMTQMLGYELDDALFNLL